MERNDNYRWAEREIEDGRKRGATSLNLAANQGADENPRELVEIPEALLQLTQLKRLILSGHGRMALPEWLGQFTRLEELDLANNELAVFPEWLRQLSALKSLDLSENKLTGLPEWLGDLTLLRELNLRANSINDLPRTLLALTNLRKLTLDHNPLSPELAATHQEGLDSVKRFLRAKAEGGRVVLNEAKLILIGEGEVGKSALLAALRSDDWVENRNSTHGIEIRQVKVRDKSTGKEITLNGWDFGGQRVYRPTHQLFFSAPAVYLVVWKPREGTQQGFVKEWIKLVKHRESGAKILVVATHGGPGARQPDIDRQEIWDEFGEQTVVDFFHVDSRPPNEDPKTRRRTGVCPGIEELKDAIARVAAGLPEVGREVPKQWDAVRKALTHSTAPYLPIDEVFGLCKKNNVDEDNARLLLRICHRVGDLIHYEHDPALQSIVVLKPDWLATAMSFVLDDKQTRAAHGLVSFDRLGELWNDPSREEKFRYDARLHPLFLRLMERFDLSYKVALPERAAEESTFWERVGSFIRSSGAGAPALRVRYTSLIAQLVPDLRPPTDELNRAWPEGTVEGDEERTQICRIIDSRNGQSASAEGLFYQLIVRLHRFSLGRSSFGESVHWQRGLILDDDYNGRALLERVGNDLRIIVRAPYPERFMSVLTQEIEYLIENFWEGLRCDVMVPCVSPCGRSSPGTGLYEVKKLIKSKSRGEYPCPVCNDWQSIDSLLRNAPAARRDPMTDLLQNFQAMKDELVTIRPLLLAQHGVVLRRFEASESRILSRIDDAFTGLMRALSDEAKEGPRLFSLQLLHHSKLSPYNWVKHRFRVTLWCEHSRLPIPLINKHDRAGVYEFEVTREWFIRAAPLLKAVAGTLSLVLPVAASATKLALDEATYKSLELQLDFGKECAEAMMTASMKGADLLSEQEAHPTGQAGITRASGAALREFQEWLRKKDASFGGLRRVQNKRQEFLWVHQRFESEY